MKRTVETSKYEFAHGKAPRGHGSWAFGNRSETKVQFFYGTYSKAKKDALVWAATHLDPCETLYVLP